jgi:hypothetical protein
VTYFMLLTVLYPMVFRPCDGSTESVHLIITDYFNCKYRLDYSVLMVKFMHMFISVNLLPLVGMHTVGYCVGIVIMGLYVICTAFIHLCSLLYSCLY